MCQFICSHHPSYFSWQGMMEVLYFNCMIFLTGPFFFFFLLDFSSVEITNLILQLFPYLFVQFLEKRYKHPNSNLISDHLHLKRSLVFMTFSVVISINGCEVAVWNLLVPFHFSLEQCSCFCLECCLTSSDQLASFTSLSL